MHNSTDFKDAVDELEIPEAARSLKEHGRAGYEYAKEGFAKAREAVNEVVHPLNWKTVLGVAAGILVVAGVILAARRRRHRGNLIQRGIHEGTRYALLVPEGWHKAQKHALNLAHDSKRESVRLWNKIPRVHVDLK